MEGKIYSDDDRKRLTREMAVFLTECYVKTTLMFPDRGSFEEVMTEAVDCILALQSKGTKKASFLSCGMLLMLPDPTATKEENDESRNIFGAAIIYYLQNKVPDVAKELGLEVK